MLSRDIRLGYFEKAAALFPLSERPLFNIYPAYITDVINIETPGEMPISGMFEYLSSKAQFDCQKIMQVCLLGSAEGRGGTSIKNLAKGTEPYARMIDSIRKAKALAEANGYDYSVGAILWLQGALLHKSAASRHW